MPTLEQEYADARPKSRALHARAVAGMPSGVAHDGRAFAPFPFYVERAEGAELLDEGPEQPPRPRKDTEQDPSGTP